jgi:hypothetical protein
MSSKGIASFTITVISRLLIHLSLLVVLVVPLWFILPRFPVGVLGGSNRIDGAGEIIDEPADHFVSQRGRDAEAGLAGLFFEAAERDRTAAAE